MHFFIEFEPLCQKLWAFVSNFGLFTMSTHQIWSCHVTQVKNFENLHFISGKVTKFLVEKFSISEVMRRKLHDRGGKHSQCL